MLTILLLLIPLLTAIVLIAAGNKFARTIALGGALIEFGVAIAALLLLQQGNSPQLFSANYNLDSKFRHFI